MEKIVVLSCGSEHEENLVNCLRMLFPEYEIEIRMKETGRARPCSQTGSMRLIKEKGARQGKKMSFPSRNC